MSLLQNEDFVLYQLRTAYLSNIKDGVGERLISVNTSVLNNPAFRAAGWVPNTSDIKRTYSPPIPTAIASEYFQAPRSAGLTGPSFVDDDEEGGMVTGRGESSETVGPALHTRRKRRKEQLEEEDSSDLSDDSDEDDGQRAAAQIKFTKMPVRSRAGSSPIQKTRLADAPELIMVTSPSKPPETSGPRRGSLSALDTVQERPRRDTVTSSEMSSENELDPSVFQRKRINSRRAAQATNLLSEKIQEDEGEDAESDDTDLDSDFAGTADSNSLLGVAADPLDSTPPPKQMASIPPAITPHNSSPNKRAKQQSQSILPTLPPARPISVVQPVSALTQALKAKSSKPADPLQRFGTLSGGGEQQAPLYIKIYAPFSNKPTKPYEILLKKTIDEAGTKVTVADAIGFALFKYQEDGLEPPIPPEKKNVNRWVLRMIEDEEVDYEFPPFARTRPIQDFTSTNNRPVRGRSRDKPWDEFALVEASPSEFAENEKTTPVYSREAAEAQAGGSSELAKVEATTPASEAVPEAPIPKATPAPLLAPQQNPITGPAFSGIRKDSTSLLDAPAAAAPNFTPRSGAPKTLRIHFISDDFTSRVSTLEVTTDTYLAEVFDRACAALHVDKALYVLKVSGTAVIAPSDRTVEALGQRTELDLARRRFVGDGAFGLSGSPGSSSPNAPLLISTAAAPAKKGKKGDRAGPSGLMHPLAQKQDMLSLTATNNTFASYKRYMVTRKQPMSFTSSSTRVLALDGEYMHIMPADTTIANAANKAAGTGKTTTVPFTSVVGAKVSSKHPKTFKVLVYRERETKRYDFEAQSREEAAEIVREVRKGIERFQEGYV